MDLAGFGRTLVGLGVLLVVVGLAILAAGRMGWPLGKLPGDVTYRGKNITVFAPIGTSLLASALLTLVLWLISALRR